MGTCSLVGSLYGRGSRYRGLDYLPVPCNDNSHALVLSYINADWLNKPYSGSLRNHIQ